MVSVASGFAVWAFGDPLLELLGYQELHSLLWFLPLMILTTTAAQVLSVWATRQQAYKRLSLSTISRSVGVAAARSLAGLVGMGVDGLVLGLIFGTGKRSDRRMAAHPLDLPSLRLIINWPAMKDWRRSTWISRSTACRRHSCPRPRSPCRRSC